MSWLERQVGQKVDSPVQSKDEEQSNEALMSPGLTGEYDLELREKAGMHQPPAPPEYMGLEGEYDENGLAKRVADAFDKDPEIDEIETLEILQEGSTIILKGSVPNQSVLSQVVQVAAKVDGTKAVNTDKVAVSNS